MMVARESKPESGPPAVPSKQSLRDRFVPSPLLYLGLGLGLGGILGLDWLLAWPMARLWLFLGLYDGLILAIALFDYWQAKRWQIALTRTCEPKLSIGRDNAVHLTLKVMGSPTQTKPTVLQVREGVPADFRVDVAPLSIDLTPQTDAELTYHVLPPRRGQFHWHPTALKLKSPWGLCFRIWQVQVGTEVEVYPDLIGLRLLSVRLSLEATGNLQRRYQVGGTEFAELREYATGDDIRLMDWKAAARRHKPIVRILEPEREQPLLILLDSGRLMTAQVEGLSRFDWALNATLALALAGLRRGDRVGIAVFDKGIRTWIAPQSGLAHLPKILAQLHHLEPTRTESDYLGVTAQVLNQYTRRALVVVLTDIMDDMASQELLLAMGRLSPRFLPLCVALRDPQVDRQAQQSTESVADQPEREAVQQLYTQAVALDLLHQRHLAFAKLKQQGTLVLDAPAPQVSDQLVEQYLRTKLRGRL